MGLSMNGWLAEESSLQGYFQWCARCTGALYMCQNKRDPPEPSVAWQLKCEDDFRTFYDAMPEHVRFWKPPAANHL
jgi:hypothetical protein